MRHPPTIATHLASHASSPCAHRLGLCHERYVIKPDGKHADCWHAGGTNHGCFLRFDLGGTPRITHVKTAVLQASAFLRIGGSGIDGGLLGSPNASARLHREYLTNGPGSIKRDGTYVGCASRYDDTDSPSAAVALGYTDSSSYSCKVEALKGGLAAGFFNVSLEVFAKHRGLAYHDAQRQVDIAGGLVFDAELVPRITAVSPRLGSLAGGNPSPNPNPKPSPNPNPNPKPKPKPHPQTKPKPNPEPSPKPGALSPIVGRSGRRASRDELHVGKG